MRQLFREVMLYSAASAVGLAVDVCLLWALVEYLDLHYLLAATLAFIVGTAVVYTLSINAIFRHRRVADPRVEFSTFAAIGVMGLLLNLLVLRLAVETLDVHYLAGKMLSVVFTFSLNFGLRRYLLFTERSADRAAPKRGPSD